MKEGEGVNFGSNLSNINYAKPLIFYTCYFTKRCKVLLNGPHRKNYLKYLVTLIMHLGILSWAKLRNAKLMLLPGLQAGADSIIP